MFRQVRSLPFYRSTYADNCQIPVALLSSIQLQFAAQVLIELQRAVEVLNLFFGQVNVVINAGGADERHRCPRGMRERVNQILILRVQCVVKGFPIHTRAILAGLDCRGMEDIVEAVDNKLHVVHHEWVVGIVLCAKSQSRGRRTIVVKVEVNLVVAVTHGHVLPVQAHCGAT